jgi:hypothetical protein
LPLRLVRQFILPRVSQWPGHGRQHRRQRYGVGGGSWGSPDFRGSNTLSLSGWIDTPYMLYAPRTRIRGCFLRHVSIGSICPHQGADRSGLGQVQPHTLHAATMKRTGARAQPFFSSSFFLFRTLFPHLYIYSSTLSLRLGCGPGSAAFSRWCARKELSTYSTCTGTWM